MKKEYLIYKLSEDLKEATRIENELFRKFDVKRGLRNEDGTGVLVGLTGQLLYLLRHQSLLRASREWRRAAQVQIFRQVPAGL